MTVQRTTVHRTTVLRGTRAWWLVRLCAVIVLACAAVVVGKAGPASAAGEIVVSVDGVTWATELPHTLFADAAKLIPLGSRSATIHLKNSSSTAGYLRLSVRNVSGAITEYARALSVVTTAPGYPDFPVLVSEALPCRVLIEALRLEAGESVAVTATLRLGDLNGRAGQDEQLDLDMIVSLSEAAALTTPRTHCPSDGTTIPLSNVAPAAPPPAADGAKPVGEPLWPVSDWLPYLAIVFGAGAFWIVAVIRRRRRQEDENDGGDASPPPEDFHFFLDDEQP